MPNKSRVLKSPYFLDKKNKYGNHENCVKILLLVHTEKINIMTENREIAIMAVLAFGEMRVAGALE